MLTAADPKGRPGPFTAEYVVGVGGFNALLCPGRGVVGEKTPSGL